MICSGLGKPLYDANCADVPGRVALLKNIAQQARGIRANPAARNFDRVEMQLSDGRAIALSPARPHGFCARGQGTQPMNDSFQQWLAN